MRNMLIVIQLQICIKYTQSIWLYQGKSNVLQRSLRTSETIFTRNKYGQI